MKSIALFCIALVLGVASASIIETTDIVGPSGTIHREQPIETEPAAVAEHPEFLSRAYPYSAYPYSGYPYRSYPYSTYPYSAYPYSATPYSAYPYSATPYSAYPYSAYPYAYNYPHTPYKTIYSY